MGSPVVAWSWDLLDPAERQLIERLSVFPAPFGLDAAKRFCRDPDLVGDLVDKSLVQVLPDHDAPYRILETIRSCGLESLQERGELATAQAIHASYYADLAEAAQPHLTGFDQLRWLRGMTE